MSQHIRFTVEYRSKVMAVDTYLHEYVSLMALLYDRFYFESFGECRGIGRCGTCHIIVKISQAQLSNKNGIEKTTLSKMESSVDGSRLSCQVSITSDLQGAHFVIVNEEDLGLY